MLKPKEERGVTQIIAVRHAGAENRGKKVESVKLRWRISYRVGGEAAMRNEMGEIPEFSIA